MTQEFSVQVADNCNVVSDIISLLYVLTDHNYTGDYKIDYREKFLFVCLSTVQLVRRSVVSAVMVSLSDAYKASWSTDALLILHLALLNKLSVNGRSIITLSMCSGGCYIMS